MSLILFTIVATLVALFARRQRAPRGRAPRYLHISPRYRRLVAELGLESIEAFLDLRSVIVSGHPNRNVGRVVLGHGAGAVEAFLKREHRVLWRDYLSSACAGFGPVSRSRREAAMLEQLRAVGVECPEVIAVGEDGKGRAFLLVRALDAAVSLRDLLRQEQLTPGERAALAHRLGVELAHVHGAGFFHADLFSTHVFPDRESGAIAFLDWQRSRRRGQVGWRERVQDLAALDATLADDLASPRERWRCLRAYFREAEAGGRARADILRRIRRRSLRLQSKRYIQEVRTAPLPSCEQNLIWLDGEALCVTRAYQEELRGVAPHWLLPVPPEPELRNWVCRQHTPRPGGNDGVLVQRTWHDPWEWLWFRVRGKPFTTPEFRQAAILFRLQRYGVRVPRLLAVGQRYVRPWWSESFLLTEQSPSVSLVEWLDLHRPTDGFTAERKRVRRLLREAGTTLRRLHDAHCYLAGRMPLVVGEDGTLMLAGVEDLVTSRHRQTRLAEEDLAYLCQSVASRRADVLRVLRGYHGGRVQGSSRRALLRAVPPQLAPLREPRTAA